MLARSVLVLASLCGTAAADAPVEPIEPLWLSPALIDFGTISVGESVMLSELSGRGLLLVSGESQEVGVEIGISSSDGSVRLVDAPYAVESNSSAAFDMEVTGIAVGPSELTLSVYLRGTRDATITAPVTFLVVEEPGGCSASGGSGLGLLSVVGLAGVLRRRRAPN